jgi:Flp pilus assembly protein TadD
MGGVDDEEHRIERVVALLDLGRHDEAAAAARDALARNPGSATHHQVLTQALICLDDAPAALRHARAAAALEPESADVLALLAGTLATVGEGAEARDAAIRAIHLAPDEWQAHAAYAHALLFGIGGRAVLGEAERAARRAIELGPHEPAAHVVFGIVRWRRDDFAMAGEAFRHALALDPGDADAQRNLASLQISQHDFETGSRTLTGGLASHPQDRGMHQEVDRARRGVLTSMSFWFMAVAFSLGGFMLATDFLWRQRAGSPAVLLALLVALGVKRMAGLPGSNAALLPWRASSGHRVTTALDWVLIALAFAVFLAPHGSAVLAWAAVAAGLAGRTGLFWLRVLRADRTSHEEPREIRTP